ncbi:hypothetical protein N7516_009990 [Penicillium verrucosum]|uniref:uncharacterized protein n=1 Tax=Penicillium verrucosum TaxID=60171 RepID=UPI002545BB7D|nr:uncharacterized protein N7516_009990 [Penicillium verrucosum]KAJ5922287.1 hypothetical protein N7516_009990 [Penicillium verrucosum]
MSDTEHHPEQVDKSECEDHPERDTEENENEPTNFEWTPELVRIGTSLGDIHPSIGLLEFHKDSAICKYRPGMTLPDPADTQECLRWIGLSDKKIVEMEQKFNELHPDYQGPRCGYDEKFKQHAYAYNEIVFPKIEEILNMFIRGIHDDHDEFEYTHKGYIEKGIQLGLRPEFAIFCGLHETDPRAIENPRLFEETWFTLGSADIMGNTLIPFWMRLKEFMVTKLLYEGKAWGDCHGRWLVYEGETIDQAKARVDDREIQRLKEQAIKENEEMLEREEQEREREHAEDMARWAEEDRLEAEMMQQ